MLNKIIAELEIGKKLILVHFNADLDAIGSAIALQRSFPDITIGTPNNINPVAKELRDVLHATVVVNPNIEDYDKVIIVDTSTPSQLKNLTKKIQNPILMDHHAKSSLWHSFFTVPKSEQLYYCDETKSSCAEIVYEVLKKTNKKIDKKIGIALLTGMLSDTGKFRYANPDTLATFSTIMKESGVEISGVFSILELDPNKDASRKIAHIKAAQRIQYEKMDDIIVAWTHIGSFEGSAARILLIVGADVGLVASQVGKEARVSAKASPKAVKRGIHLGKLLEEIGIETNCGGGGHAAAAGLNGPGDAQEIMKKTLHRIQEILSKTEK